MKAAFNLFDSYSLLCLDQNVLCHIEDMTYSEEREIPLSMNFMVPATLKKGHQR